MAKRYAYLLNYPFAYLKRMFIKPFVYWTVYICLLVYVSVRLSMSTLLDRSFIELLLGDLILTSGLISSFVETYQQRKHPQCSNTNNIMFFDVPFQHPIVHNPKIVLRSCRRESTVPVVGEHRQGAETLGQPRQPSRRDQRSQPDRRQKRATKRQPAARQGNRRPADRSPLVESLFSSRTRQRAEIRQN